ncbi:aminopeptidase family protein P [Pedobacter sp. HDW13]|uniref:aminopeptidase family protein P n=1 Tax=Pedobacter sp. HDW13 TaxID=2714940 RepID=UPI001F0D43F7|nr:aminopeptidase family protein P [Pedobacter sp. HDW13]
MPKNSTVAFNYQLISISLALEIQTNFGKHQINTVNADLLSAIWLNRPALPTEKAFLIEEKDAGLSISAKLTEVKAQLETNGADSHLISSLDDIAWLFNIRGKDVDYNPVALSFALITPNEVKLFIDVEKLSESDINTLKQQSVALYPYAAITEELKELLPNTAVFIDFKRNCFGMYQLLPATVKVISGTNPSTHLKSLKNETEVNHIRKAMVQDGVAMTRFFKWMEERLGEEQITEWSAAEKLATFRAEQPGFAGLSFNTIAGFNANGALPHYSVSLASSLEIQPDGLFLVDSGGQYLYGTTDITRVMPMANYSAQQADDYTLVLKGLIEGSKLIFPEGTKGYQIDSICRKPLWEHTINFGHGTGHGIGFFLNVHEGPQNISPANVDVAFKPGMVTSIEPGIYRPGEHGVRIENLVLCTNHSSSAFGNFLSFETLTLCYIDTRIINKALLEADQLRWLNTYNSKVFNQLQPHLTAGEANWLKEKCQPI